MKKLLPTFLIAALSPALCLAFSPMPPSTCLNETAQVSIRLNDTNSDVSALKDELDKEIADAKKVAKEMNLDKFELQSMNYNINSQNIYNKRLNQQNGPEQYTLNGTVNFSVLPSAKAIDVMQALIKKGLSVSMSSNSYNNMSCTTPPPVYPPNANVIETAPAATK